MRPAVRKGTNQFLAKVTFNKIMLLVWNEAI